MTLAFYISSALAIVAAAVAVTRERPAWALVWLIASLLATAAVLFALGGPFVAALEVILYAGAVMVLFVFAVMMLHAADTRQPARRWRPPRAWLIPALLAATMLALMTVVLWPRTVRFFAPLMLMAVLAVLPTPKT